MFLQQSRDSDKNIIPDLPESGGYFFITTGSFGRIRETQVDAHTFAKPHRAVFGRVVTDGHNQVKRLGIVTRYASHNNLKRLFFQGNHTP
ncbi:MAG: hypothetical protein AB9891_13705 [Anaerolineaceae bacterium]